MIENAYDGIIIGSGHHGLILGAYLAKAGLNVVAPTIVGVSVPLKLLHIIEQPMVFLGLGTYAIGTLCWMAAMAQIDLSLLYPLTSLNYILIALSSAFLFHETISLRRGGGIAIVVIGVLFLAKSQRKQEPIHDER